MSNYWVKTPPWLKKLFPRQLIWDIPVDKQQAVYLTFDDGPNPRATPFVLSELAKYNAKATFFCVGNNVSRHPAIYQDVINAGHSAGNHTYDHINGWKTQTAEYINNVARARKLIQSRLFRPPYGRMKFSQLRKLTRGIDNWKVYMWDVLSGDFDKEITPEQCASNVLSNIRPGSIVLFHDSEKAFDRMSYALPLVLDYCRERNWAMKVLPG